MERQPSPRIERTSSFENEPLTLTKEQYQAALAAVIQSYAKENASFQPVSSEEKPEKMAAPLPPKERNKM
ncbi:hypothetical protein DITRI_Ditri03aG0141700 [Diplodiscus trichospermus]